MASARALQLKEEGNRYFTGGDYAQAEASYSKAIIIDGTNPLLYTNRAMARLKLHLYEAVIPDCESSISLMATNMKAYYYIAQAQLELGLKVMALGNAEKAYELCSGLKIPKSVGEGAGAAGKRTVESIKGYDPKWASSLTSVAALVLRCKKEVWDVKERKRLRELNPLLEELVEELETKKDKEIASLHEEELGVVERQELIDDTKQTYQEKIETLRRTWQAAAKSEEKQRVVPDWMIDDITFAVMYDPVVTNTGHSYERAAILEHLKRSPTDPLTRAPLHERDLRTNLGLRDACAEFLAENGWAVDW